MPTFRFATRADAVSLRDFSERLFVTTYGGFNTPENMAMYVEKAFSLAQYEADLSLDSLRFIVAEEEGRLIAYTKLCLDKPSEINPTLKAVEISRFYVDEPYQGKGLAQLLMNHTLDWAQAYGAKMVWLAVWQHYPKAVRFYEKCGFQIVGSTTFVLGTDVQDDYLMEKKVS
ncbi:MAG: GNAT family N-acetyltransferase [Spirosomataceae bacterium]